MAWLVLAIMTGLVTALIKTQHKPAVLFASVLFLFFALGLIEAKPMLANFVNPALMTLAILLIVSAPLERSHYLQYLSQRLFDPQAYFKSLFRLSGITAAVSGLLNNTAVVATMMGVIKANSRIIPSQYLLPLSYIAILGGTMTLVGTSTNLIVNSLAISQGHPGFKLLDFIYVGLPLVLGGTTLILLMRNNFV